MNQETSPSKRYAEVTFRKAGQAYLFSADQVSVQERDKVIVETEQGIALGSVKRTYELTQAPPPSLRIFPILRVASPEELERSKYHRLREKEAFRFCRERVVVHKLPMKMVRTEHLFSGTKMIFYFSAEGRIDFRDLVRDLARHFRMRIEMRQIGVRDSAKLIGGAGPCGQELCCSRFLRNFSPVSIRMAKDQSLALNPQKVSGVCGRLMCCLSYEQSVYKQLRRNLPKIGRDVETIEGIGKVREVHPLRETVRIVFLDRDPVVEKEFHVSDLPEYKDAFAKETHPAASPISETEKKAFDFADFDNFDDRGQARIKGRRGVEPLMEPRNLPYPLPPFDDDEEEADDDEDAPRTRRRARSSTSQISRSSAPSEPPTRREARISSKERGPQDARRDRNVSVEKSRHTETAPRSSVATAKTRVLDIRAKARHTKTPLEESTSPQDLPPPSDGSTSPPLERPLTQHSSPHHDAMPPHNGVTLSQEGTTPPHNGVTLSQEGTTPPHDGVTLSQEGTTPPHDGVTLSQESATPPNQAPTLPNPAPTLPNPAPLRTLETRTASSDIRPLHPPNRFERRNLREEQRNSREEQRNSREEQRNLPEEQRNLREEQRSSRADVSEPREENQSVRLTRRALRGDDGTERRGMRGNEGTDRRGMRGNEGTDRRGMRGNEGTDRRGMRSDEGTDRRGMRSDEGTDRRGMRGNEGTDRRGMRSDEGTDRRGMRSDEGTDRRGMRGMGADGRAVSHTDRRGGRDVDGNRRDVDGNQREPYGAQRAFDMRERRGSRVQEESRQRPPQGRGARVGASEETDGTHTDRRSPSAGRAERGGRPPRRPEGSGPRTSSSRNEPPARQGEGAKHSGSEGTPAPQTPRTNEAIERPKSDRSRPKDGGDQE
ncbi:hypothetical protein L6R29_05395 [Myxococcota bacterium]|nr:hypothetical protein [Myxococcota bacterium]